MSNLSATIQESWEKSLFVATVLATAAFLGYLAFAFLKDDGETAWETTRNKEPFRYFDMKDKSYMDAASLAKGVNPLFFTIKVALPPQKATEAPKPQGQGKPAPNPKQAPPKKNTPANPKQPAAKPAAPKTPPRIISVRYRGFVQGGGEEIAFYVATDSNGKKTEARAARSGASIHGMLEIKSFDSSSLTLKLGGKEVVVNKGKKQDFVIQ